MRERYESRFRRDWGLYTAGSPLILTSGSLLEDTNRGKLLCQIRADTGEGYDPPFLCFGDIIFEVFL